MEKIEYHKIPSLIIIEEDGELVRVGEDTIENVLSLPKKSFISWLYCVLHIKNPQLFNADLAESIKANTLNKKILEALGEHTVEVECNHLEKFPGEENIIQLKSSGIKLRDQYLNNKTEHLKIACLRPNLSPGFTMYRNFNLDQSPKTINRYYISVKNYDVAVSTWIKIIYLLNQYKAKYSTKIFTLSEFYPRADSIVIYSDSFDQKNNEIIEDKLGSLINNMSTSDFGEQSVFTTPLTHCKNIQFAAENTKASAGGLSQGQYECQILGNAILDTLLTGIDLNMTYRWRIRQSKKH